MLKTVIEKKIFIFHLLSVLKVYNLPRFLLLNLNLKVTHREE